MQVSRNIVLLLCAAVVTMTSIGMHSFSLFLRPIEAEFDWSRTMVTVPYMFGMLGWGVGTVLFGKLADDLGARPVVLGGTLLMAAGLFGMSLSQNLWQLSLSYGIMVGMAMGACGLVIISLLVGPRMAGLILGLSFIVHQLGSAGGPMLASIAFDVTGSYDGFMTAMGLILLASALLIHSTINTDMRLAESETLLQRHEGREGFGNIYS